MTSEAEFARLIEEPEGTRIEFKEALRHYDFDKLVKYVVALANEGGGHVVLGVADRRPRTITGTEAFAEPGRTESGIATRIGRQVRIEEYQHDGKRVLIVHVPGRDAGAAWNDQGSYWKRNGDSLVAMGDDELRRIHSEAVSDFSAEACNGASFVDLAPSAIAEFRRRWAARERNRRIETWADEETLRNAELLRDGRLTYAALILFGTSEALSRLLPQAEVVFEYRSSEAAGPAQDRAEFREGFLLFHDKLWEHIDRRNDRQSYQEGFFRIEIPTFDEGAIREALLNAVSHRDYRFGSSVFVRQYSRRLEVVSPGGLPAGVTPDNIIDQQNPRNRRLAEALARCGLIERAGQGVNLMFERSVRQSKPLPDFRGTADHEVRLTLRGEVTNPAFLGFFENVNAETLATFDTRDLLILDRLQRDEGVSENLRHRISRLIDLGVVESVGRGRGVRFFLSRDLYAAMGQKGAYTRKRGLDHETHKALLLRHLHDNSEGSPLSDLEQVLPQLSRRTVQLLLQELRSEGSVSVTGGRRWARWHAAKNSLLK